MRIVQVSTVFKNCNSGYFWRMRVIHSHLKLQGLWKALYMLCIHAWGKHKIYAPKPLTTTIRLTWFCYTRAIHDNYNRVAIEPRQLTQWLLGWWISVVGKILTGALDRQRCRRFDPRKCIWFLWWGKCLCNLHMSVGVHTALLAFTQISSFTERFKLC